jgi:Zn-dependent protease
MGWSWRIATVFGIDIKIHISFLLALLWGGLMWSDEGLAGAVYGVFLTLLLFVIVVLHELGHSWAARRYGIPVHDILLLPIGGVARLSHMPQEPRKELVVALAGPLVNLALMLMVAPILVFQLAMQAMAGAPFRLPSMAAPGVLNVVVFLFVVNLSLFLFNMLPAFPMDGGRVLRAVLSLRLAHARATRIATLIGRVFAIGFGAFGLISGNFLMAVVGLFVFHGATSEASQEEPQPVPVPVEAQFPVLLADTPAHLAFERVMSSPYAAVAVVGPAGEFLGLVTQAGMRQRWAAGVRGPVSQFVDVIA